MTVFMLVDKVDTFQQKKTKTKKKDAVFRISLDSLLSAAEQLAVSVTDTPQWATDNYCLMLIQFI